MKPCWGLAGLLLAAPGLAAAQEWTWQTGGQGRYEYDSNPGLQEPEPGAGRTVVLSGKLGLQRSTKVQRSQLDLDLIGTQGDGRANQGLQGHLAFQHSLRAPLDTWTLGAAYRRERNLGTTARASDVALRDAVRSTADASLGWTRLLSETLSTQAQWQWSDNRVQDAPAGNNYRLASGSLSLQYQSSETASQGISLSRTRQVREDGGGTITTLSARLSANQSLSETLRWGGSVGWSETTRAFTVSFLVCPLPVAFCNTGLVRPVTATQEVRRRSRDEQYSLNASWRFAETGELSASAARALNPGLFGQTREDSLGLSASRSWIDGLRWQAGMDLSRSLRPAATADAPGARSRLGTFTLGLSQQLAERWLLEWQAQHRVYDASDPQTRARSNRFSISLQYLGGKVPGSP